MMSIAAAAPWPDLQHLVPLLALGIGQDLWTAAHQQREEAHAVRVIGHHEEVERSRQLEPAARSRT